jgi:hypothetical protein
MFATDRPEDVRSAGRQVREIAPSLRKAGVDIRASRTGKRRALRIRKISDPGQEPSGSLPNEGEKTCH